MSGSKRLLILIMLCFSLLTAGCWDRKEINQIGFAVGLGIDKEKDNYLITTQMALPSLLEGGGGGEEAPVWVVGGKGKTIFQAIRDVNTRSARKPFWGHLNVIVIGEEVAKDGILPVLDLLSRGRELRRLNYVVIAKGKARDILEAEPKLESINAIFIRDLIENRKGQSVAPAVTLNDLMLSLSTAGKESVLPKIEALEQESFAPPKKSEGAPQEEGKGGEEKPKQILELRGAGIFKEDKLVNWLDEEATRGFLWVVEQVAGGIIVVRSPVETDREVSLEIMSNKSLIIPQVEGGNIKIKFQVLSTLNLVENTGVVSLETSKLIKKLKQRASSSIKKEITKAIKIAQASETDIFGIGERLRTQYPAVWKNIEWSEIFPGVDIEIEVKVNIEEANMTLKPVTPPKQRRK